MGLSDKERRALDMLEGQFAGRARLVRPFGTIDERRLRRFGWTALVVGFAAMIALLTVSVIASFIGFLVGAAGTLLVVNFGHPAVFGARVRRLFGGRPQQPAGEDPP